MAAKPAPESEPTPAPTPVDLVSSIPLNVQLAPESLASLGAPPAGTAEPVTAPGVATGMATGTPVNVTVMAPQPVAATVTKGEGQTLAPTTTEADDLVSQGQRKINEMWEECQRAIALGVTFSTVAIIGAVVIIAMITGHDIAQATATQVNYLVVMTTLILSFYFSRTNHEKVGGVGPKPEPPYTGR